MRRPRGQSTFFIFSEHLEPSPWPWTRSWWRGRGARGSCSWPSCSSQSSRHGEVGKASRIFSFCEGTFKPSPFLEERESSNLIELAQHFETDFTPHDLKLSFYAARPEACRTLRLKYFNPKHSDSIL